MLIKLLDDSISKIIIPETKLGLERGLVKHYKALILDLDGTTIASRGGSLASKPVEQAIKEAHSVVKVAIATGRSWHLAIDVIRQLGITEPCILDVGSQIVSPTTGKVYFSRPLSVRMQQEIIALCLPFKYNDFMLIPLAKQHC